ncbi:PTS glucitol/sorbitol transporter subunit IIA [Enterococcus saccharolyticus]|uniref:PTS system sorbitol-specific IIA component n=1 Tax=Enterococcus saccharolyticus subsp. saccharolyticus ATCC 43076 TaxID=1139996 RepID=S0NV59_9ENTE|nr:PTS glucitol/sorbitol transporter subunit IIA [Enterococcus saccharolyticus]EOT30565.1 PTS system sorbitol-specific IIA component [Enterococcus saccharolyticus subsp. saccharolyticus ATCC 43076]EOT80126.1 PTS system sorbitol-specific IIA component [Enterococcus saccharolyticus subsp. saccharolyticus ATCC 43076]OJG87937.1 PTS system sorbitol-specific IIA component [Enterococcus saccharolyticus]
MSVFTTTVLSIGPEAELFKEEKMVILFGKDAPDALADYCYNIEVRPTTGAITVKQELVIDDNHYQITSVGDVVLPNLENLGHITIKFDGATTPELPGTLYVEDKPMPEIGVGTTISIQ